MVEKTSENFIEFQIGRGKKVFARETLSKVMAAMEKKIQNFFIHARKLQQ